MKRPGGMPGRFRLGRYLLRFEFIVVVFSVLAFSLQGRVARFEPFST
jgi:hypothetical protein